MGANHEYPEAENLTRFNPRTRDGCEKIFTQLQRGYQFQSTHP